MDNDKFIRDLNTNLEFFSPPPNLPHDSQFIENAILRELGPYFRHVDKLHEILYFKTHIWECAIFLSLKNRPEKLELFNEIFSIVNNAHSSNTYLFSHYLRSTWQSIREALKNFTDLYFLQRKKELTPTRLSVKISFQEIGLIIEESLSHFVKHISYLLHAHSHGEPLNLTGDITLGKATYILSSNAKLKQLTHPAPLHIPLNQLRNIAYHSNYTIQNDPSTSICTYGSNNKIHVQYADIIKTIIELIDLYNILKTANSFYTVDNENFVHDLMATSTVTTETIIATISEILTYNKLQIQEFEHTSNRWKITILDPYARQNDDIKNILRDTLQAISFLSG
ncbi:hypothetical protein GTA51_18170 [Desulfovibrio aerotolerans]|uniref:Uncharacterized protein n=1 Tax=Solidesulfovibrio aerotolerans TaxID=295255 RepID=A0A7C9IVN0_9BACT|nr:hypothetical protein [Solidesulfovibrio aerotolerans]MYL85040.1 hypothetical protein [Solidesulfovibrio aerotolerans]